MEHRNDAMVRGAVVASRPGAEMAREGLMEMSEVKATLIQIEALKDERDGYKKEAKRAQEDIDSLLATLTKKVCFPQEELPFGGPKEVSA